MQFQNPYTLLHLVWLVPLVLGLAWFAAARRQRRLTLMLGNPTLTAALSTNVSVSRRRWRALLLLAGVGLVVAALARPQWGRQLLPRRGLSRDLLVVLDVSRSMLARDVPPGTRLEHAKLFVRELLEQTPGDRYGLIPFAGSAYLECPLTPNRDGLLLFLADLDTSTAAVGGTNLELALKKGLEAFAAAEGRHRAMLVISDGETLDGDYHPVLEQCRKEGIPVFVVGIGDPVVGSLIQLPNRQFVTDRDGQRVHTKLNETGLREIATATHGEYVRSTAADPGVERIAKGILALIPEETQGAGLSYRPIERYQWPLGLGLACLLARLLIGERRSGPRPVPRNVPKVAILVLGAWLGLIGTGAAQLAADPGPTPAAPGVAPAPGPKTTLQDELKTLTEANIKQLEARLAKATDPREQAWAHYNLGVNYQLLGQQDEAQRHYDQAAGLPADAPEVRAASYLNQGVLSHREALGKLQQDPDAALSGLKQAREFYQEAMRTNPELPGVGTDQELALRHEALAQELKKQLEQLKQQQQQARDQAKAAHDQQQQANQEPDPKSREEKQQEAAQKTQQATEATEKAAETAKQLGREPDAQQMEQAKEHLQQAKKEQQQALAKGAQEEEQQAAGKKAEEELAQAMQQLGAKPDQKAQKPEGQEQPPKNGTKPDQQLAGAKPDAQPGQTPPPAEAKDLDKEHAAQILRLMEQKEKDFREVMRKARQENARLQPIERDW